MRSFITPLRDFLGHRIEYWVFNILLFCTKSGDQSLYGELGQSSRSCSWGFAGRMSVSLLIFMKWRPQNNTYSEGMVGNLWVGLVFKERFSSLVSLSWVSTVGSRSCTSFYEVLFRSGVDIMLTLRWRRRCANVTLLRCWLCIAETLAKRWCQRWHCSDVDDVPPVKLIVLSGAGLSNSGASPAAPWAQSLMTKRYELWNIFIYFPHQENVSHGRMEGELNN